MAERAAIKSDIVALLDRGLTPLADDAFNSLALRVFKFQFQHNIPYRQYCERRIGDVAPVTRWQEIPAVPTAAFKAAALICGNAEEAEAVFRTSGTTRGVEQRGSHYVLDLGLYRRALLAPFRQYVLSGRSQMPMASLIASADQTPDSSLSYMVTTVMQQLASPDSIFAIDRSGIRGDALHAWLEAKARNQEAVCILGTSLAFLHWFDTLEASGTSFRLPAESVIMDTGGFKGSTRAITPAELHERYAELLGVTKHHVVNEYGMTEMLSQFYEVRGVKRAPPWVRTMVVDPETLAELPSGETGLLRHIDLANVFSVSAIQTEDVGRVTEGGFELLGRVAGAAPRGCSIAMDMFLGASR